MVSPSPPRGNWSGFAAAFPREICADQLPRAKVLQLAEAMNARYPDRLWWHADGVAEISDGRLSAITLDRFEAMVDDAAVLRRARRGRGASDDDAEITSMPREVTRKACNSATLWRPLQAVRCAPWVSADGAVHAAPGYHEGCRTYLAWEGEPADPDAVSDDDVRDAMDRLLDLEFASDADRLHAVGLLVQIVRYTPGHASPLHLVVADTRQAGKSLFCGLVGRLLTGSSPRATPLGSGLEQGYTIAAALAGNPPLLYLENLPTGSVLGGALMHILASADGEVSFRQVRSSRTFAVDPTRTVLLSNGNQVDLDDEMGRRVHVVRLRPRPAGRPFRTPDVRGWVETNRRHVLSCLLRVVRDWHQVGCPPPPRELATFERWSRLVGGPACWAQPGLAHRWHEPAARPVPEVEREIALLGASWPRSEDGAPLGALPARAILEIVDQRGLHALAAQAGQGSDRARVTSFGAFLARLSRSEAPVAGEWRVERRASGSNAAYSVIPASPDGTSLDLQGGGPASVPGVSSSYPGPSGPIDPPLPPRVCEAVYELKGEERGVPPPKGPEGPGYAVGTPAKPGGTLPGFRVEVPQDDPAYREVVAMQRRGLPVCAEEWARRTAAAAESLAVDASEEAQGRLRTLRSYASAVLAQAVDGGRARCSWMLQGPGRLGAVGPPLQSITKAFGLRGAVRAPEGRTLVVADWISAHVWIAAGLAHDERLLGDLAEGDLYVHAAGVWCPELAEGGRKASKTAALATLNGAGADRLAAVLARYHVQVTPSEARSRRERWLSRYPDLRRWRLDAEGRRAWTTSLGRRVVMPDDVPGHAAAGWMLQSHEADALRIVMRRYSGSIVLAVHDEVVAEEAVEDAAARARELGSVMGDALAEAAGLIRGAPCCDVQVRPTWSP